MLLLRPLVEGTFAAMPKLADSPEFSLPLCEPMCQWWELFWKQSSKNLFPINPLFWMSSFWKWLSKDLLPNIFLFLDSSLLARCWPESQDTLFAIICWICANHRFGLLLARYWPESQDTVFSYFVLRFWAPNSLGMWPLPVDTVLHAFGWIRVYLPMARALFGIHYPRICLLIPFYSCNFWGGFVTCKLCIIYDKRLLPRRGISIRPDAAREPFRILTSFFSTTGCSLILDPTVWQV